MAAPGLSFIPEAVLKQLPERTLRLRFAPEVEAQYRAFNSERALTLTRTTLSLAIVLFAIFAVVDLRYFGRLRDPIVFGLFVGLCGTMIGLAVLATFVEQWRPRLIRWLPLMLFINGTAMAVGVARCTQIGLDPPYEILILHLLYVFFLAGMLVTAAVTTGTGVIVFYVVAQLVAAEGERELVHQAAFLLFTLLLGGIGCYLNERVRRRNWLQSRLVEDFAIHDDMTGLHNRRYLVSQATRLLAQAQREQTPVALLLVDVDHFKRYNDAQGHLAGDECLRMLARAIAATARRPLDTAARYGGEEFAVLLYGCGVSAAGRRAEHLRESIERLGIGHPLGGVVTVSIGVAATHAGDTATLEKLTAAADEALYRAKNAGRNCVRSAAELAPPAAPAAAQPQAS